MHLPSPADRKEPIPATEGWYVVLNNGHATFISGEPLQWPASMICRIRFMKRMSKPAHIQPILGDAEGMCQ